MKYRIVETGEGFIVQERVFFHWRDVETYPIVKTKNSFYISQFKENIVWDKLEEALEYLNVIKKYPIKYRGHVINCYVSRFRDFYFCEPCKGCPFPVVEGINEIKKYIDMIEYGKERKTKILKIYDDYGNRKK